MAPDCYRGGGTGPVCPVWPDHFFGSTTCKC